ncbi:hypothetical protein Daus18300_008550 [Diaporthe australafricana]|uniref:Uncharacterized protein n=1 Tax=Diaporthe australafricana TaxID=127596 RepID=A0ABR3WI02_9PEZI
MSDPKQTKSVDVPKLRTDDDLPEKDSDEFKVLVSEAPGVKAWSQWIVHDNIILHQTILENLGPTSVDSQRIELHKEMLVRDLDYEDSTYSFNKDKKEGYDWIPGPPGLGWATVHRLDPNNASEDHEDGKNSTQPTTDSRANIPPRTSKEAENSTAGPHSQFQRDAQKKGETDTRTNHFQKNQKDPLNAWSVPDAHAVACVTALYIDGSAEKVQSGDEGLYFEGRSLEEKGEPSSILEIVAAYKMVVLPKSKKDWGNFWILAEEADVSAILKKETKGLWGDGPITPLCELNLSTADQEISLPFKKDHGRVPTSGDFTTPGTQAGKSTIGTTIEYLTWRHLENILSPDNAITDTALQILKVNGYVTYLRDEGNERDEYMNLLKDIWVPWLYTLSYLDMRGAFAWAYTQDDGIKRYRLDDQVWIWRSLGAMGDLDLWNYHPLNWSTLENTIRWNGWDDVNQKDRWMCHIYNLPIDKDCADSETLAAFDKFLSFAVYLQPEQVQMGILKRFTLQNDVVSKRMLAVARSSRDTRFILHSRDTALFYGYDQRFFEPVAALWKNTMEWQIHHEENMYGQPGNTLRCALGAMAGARKFCVNKLPPSELHKSCVEALIRLSAHNGFITGICDREGRYSPVPSIFTQEEDRDYYYHVGFETIYILLFDANKVNAVSTSKTQGATQTHSLAVSVVNAEDRDAQILHLLRELRVMIAEGCGGETARLPSGQRASKVKKWMPFDRKIIDARSVSIIDEEWFYPCSDFLTTGQIGPEELLYMISLNPAKQPQSDGLVDKILEELRTKASSFESACGKQLQQYVLSEGSDSKVAVFAASTPKRRYQDDKDSRQYLERFRDFYQLTLLHDVQSNTNPHLWNLWSHIGAARSAWVAKKRFIWLPHADENTAFLCWAASTDAEKPAMSSFFDRHSNLKKLCIDDTSMEFNTWQTELHLSFYTLVDVKDANYAEPQGLPRLVKAKFPGNSGKEMRRASMGFRFDGDFFDKYWTCHFIQHVPGLPRDDTHEWNFEFDQKGLSTDLRDKQRHWWQRKVLELHLLERILKAVTQGSIGILRHVREELGVDKTILSFSILTSEDYKTSQRDWQDYETILQAVEDEVTAIMRTLQSWSSRGEDRGQEKPRWTHSDEERYRSWIRKFQRDTERETARIQMVLENTRKLRDALSQRRDRLQKELEVRREGHIRYFTNFIVVRKTFLLGSSEIREEDQKLPSFHATAKPIGPKRRRQPQSSRKKSV